MDAAARAEKREGKTASLLAILARRDAALRRHHAGGAIRFDLPVTREETADYLGLTLETVSRQMSALKRDGVITPEEGRTVRVPDYDRLVAEAGDAVSTPEVC